MAKHITKSLVAKREYYDGRLSAIPIEVQFWTKVFLNEPKKIITKTLKIRGKHDKSRERI